MQTESARDFDNVGLDFLSAFNDVQLILQNSSDVRVPLPYANTIRDKFLVQLQMIWRKKTGLAFVGLHVCLRDFRSKMPSLTLNFCHSLLIAGDGAIQLICYH